MLYTDKPYRMAEKTSAVIRYFVVTGEEHMLLVAQDFKIIMEEHKKPQSPFVPKEIKADWIGPPDPVSKIRPIRQFIPTNETAIEKLLRERQASVLEWNHTYWKKHNKAFKRERRQFVEGLQGRPGADAAVSDDQMADFYRDFMERNQRKHRQYNLQWYGRNVLLLGLAGAAAPLRLLRTLRLLR